MDEYFEIFRTGRHTDTNGNQKEWTEADLSTIAARYNEQKEHEAPLVIGHPATNHPAYGWVESLKVEGGKLLAKAAQIVPEFAEAIKSGLFKKRSISLYPDMLLQHVGFLGAVPPAVKGLKDISFATTEGTEITEYEITDDTLTPNNFNEIISENTNMKADLAEKVLKVTELTEKLQLSESELAELKNSQNKVQREFAEFKQTTADKEFKTYIESKVAARSITPAQAEEIFNFKKHIDGSNNGNQNFTEGQCPTDFLKKLVETLPRILPETPNIPGTAPEIKPFNVTEVAAKASEYVDNQQKKGISISFTEAVATMKALITKYI